MRRFFVRLRLAFRSLHFCSKRAHLRLCRCHLAFGRLEFPSRMLQSVVQVHRVSLHASDFFALVINKLLLRAIFRWVWSDHSGVFAAESAIRMAGCAAAIAAAAALVKAHTKVATRRRWWHERRVEVVARMPYAEFSAPAVVVAAAAAAAAAKSTDAISNHACATSRRGETHVTTTIPIVDVGATDPLDTHMHLVKGH